MSGPSATDLLRRLQAAGAIEAAGQVLPRKGRLDWLERDLFFRFTVREGGEANLVWTLYVGDPLLGRPFDEGGILALVPIRRDLEGIGEGAFSWPRDEAEVATMVSHLAAVLAAARAFVADRHDLCLLLLEEADHVERHGLVADLQAAWAERIVRAIAIAASMGDQEVLVRAAEILHQPDSDAPASLRNQASFWAEQWTWQSGHHIELPGVELRSHLESRPTPDASDDDFWDRLG